jgi:hypothetical protein
MDQISISNQSSNLTRQQQNISDVITSILQASSVYFECMPETWSGTESCHGPVFMPSLLSRKVVTADGEVTIPCVAHDGLAYYGVSDDDALKAILSGESEREIDEEEFQKLRALLSSTDAQVRQAVQKLYESHQMARWQEFHADCDRIAATIQVDPDTTDEVKKQMDIEVFSECLLPFHYGFLTPSY